MEEQGLSKDKVIEFLSQTREKDLRYGDGKIFSSMCTAPHPIALEAYKIFIETNMGDAGLFKGTRELEHKTIRMLGSIMGSSTASGFLVTGGTEANLVALWIARNMFKGEGNEVIVPETAHFSFDKAANILGLKLVKAGLKEDFSIDENHVKRMTNENTIGIVGVAGSTEYGAVDDIEALSEIAMEEKLYLHVDAAFGGLVIPFLRQLGYETKSFDFSIEGVSSITVDPHKMGLAPIPSGGLLVRDATLLKYIETSSPYLIEKRQNTLTGTRAGASIASTYAVLKHLGKEGYRKVVKHCMDLTMKLYHELNRMGCQTIKPKMNIIAFGHKKQDEIANKLMEKGWVISRTRKGEIRLVIMPHIKEKNVNDFIRDLKEILEGFGT